MLALLAHSYIIVGYVLIVVCLPRIVLSVRQSWPALVLVASLWLILAAAIQTNIRRLAAPLILTDVMRVVGVTLFIVYVFLHRRELRLASRA